MKYSLLFIVSVLFSQLSYTSELSRTPKAHSMQLRDRLSKNNFARLIELPLETKEISKPTIPLTSKAKKIETIYCGLCHINVTKKYYDAHLRTKKHRYYDNTENESSTKSSDTSTEPKVEATDEHEDSADLLTIDGLPENSDSFNKPYKCKLCLGGFDYIYELAEHKVPGHEKSCAMHK